MRAQKLLLANIYHHMFPPGHEKGWELQAEWIQRWTDMDSSFIFFIRKTLCSFTWKIFHISNNEEDFWAALMMSETQRTAQADGIWPSVRGLRRFTVEPSGADSGVKQREAAWSVVTPRTRRKVTQYNDGWKVPLPLQKALLLHHAYHSVIFDFSWPFSIRNMIAAVRVTDPGGGSAPLPRSPPPSPRGGTYPAY